MSEYVYQPDTMYVEYPNGKKRKEFLFLYGSGPEFPFQREADEAPKSIKIFEDFLGEAKKRYPNSDVTGFAMPKLTAAPSGEQAVLLA